MSDTTVLAFRFVKPVPGLGAEYQERRYTVLEMRTSRVLLPVVPAGFTLCEVWVE